MKAKELILELQKLDPETDLYSNVDDCNIYISKFPPIYEMWIEPKDLNTGYGKLISVKSNPNDKFNTKIIVIG